MAPPDPLSFISVAERAASFTADSAAGESLDRQWDDLVDRTGAPPFLRPGWIAAWHESYGAGRLEIVEARRESELVGALPLDVRRRSCDSPANSHTPLFGAVACDADAARALAHDLIERRPSRIRLDHVDPHTEWARELSSALDTTGWRRAQTTASESPFVRTDGTWDEYRSTLSRNLRKQLARRRRRLEESGELAVTVHTALRGLDAAFGEFIALESSGWKASEGTAIASRPESVAFYRRVALWAAERGWLRIATLRHAGRPIAAELGLECDGLLYALKSGFDPDYKRFGPGQLLTYESLAYAFSSGLRSYEFLGGRDAYKSDWASEARERLGLEAFPPTATGRVRSAASAVRRAARRSATRG